MSANLDNPVEDAEGLRGGTLETKEYYDQKGWTVLEDGHLTDNRLWRAREDGPLRIASRRLRVRRIREALAQVGDCLNLLECGCGGNPELDLLDLCAHYTGADFSSTGLAVADQKLGPMGVPYRLVEGDVCSMPFPDEGFDAVYSAHMVYHIRDPNGQAAALREMLRVTKQGGIVVLVVANPRPLLFPGRLIQRLIADAPLVGNALYGLRSRLLTKPPIPFNPRPLGWMRRQLEPFGRVKIIGNELTSVWFNQHISEKAPLGRLAWKLLAWLEREHPAACAWLGNYAQITVRKVG